MVEREKGVAQTSCPNCGTSLNAVAQPDGATAYELCPKCYSQPKPEKAASKTTRETGTTIETSGEEDN